MLIGPANGASNAFRRLGYALTLPVLTGVAAGHVRNILADSASIAAPAAAAGQYRRRVRKACRTSARHGSAQRLCRWSRPRLPDQRLPIRYAPDLLFLQGEEPQPWKDKWVVSAEVPAGTVRRLFPLEWDESRGAHLFGGCGAYVDDRIGPALVHTGAVHDGAGMLRGNAFVIRRTYPAGEPRWVFPADHQATALDAGDGLVYITFNSGELVILHAEDGNVHRRQDLRVNGHVVVPLSLARLGPGRLAIGTLDGRVLACSLAA